MRKSIQDEHLDMLIRLAYRREEERLCERYNKEESEAAIRLDSERKAITYAMFLEKMAAIEKEKARTARIQKIRKYVPRFVNIAACLALLFCIAAPIAVAKVEHIRVRVMKLLIDIQEDHTRLSLVEDEEAAFYVPEEWKGEYYPAYIPDGFSIVEIGGASFYVTFKSPSGNYIHFIEADEAFDMGMDSEDAVSSYSYINGLPAILIAKEDYHKIIWSNGDRYFLITTSLAKDECIKIATSVQKIKK